MNKLIKYIQESKVELKNVSWPSKKDVQQHTILVIIISLGVALFLGLTDYVLTLGLDKFIK
jgi:preprotein translocase subunit SecE